MLKDEAKHSREWDSVKGLNSEAGMCPLPIWRLNRDRFNYLAHECSTLDITVNILISHEIQCNYGLLREMTAPFMSLSRKLQSGGTITAVYFCLWWKLCSWLLSHPGCLMGSSWQEHNPTKQRRIIKIISQNHFPKANAKVFPIFIFYF